MRLTRPFAVSRPPFEASAPPIQPAHKIQKLGTNHQGCAAGAKLTRAVAEGHASEVCLVDPHPVRARDDDVLHHELRPCLLAEIKRHRPARTMLRAVLGEARVEHGGLLWRADQSELVPTAGVLVCLVEARLLARLVADIAIGAAGGRRGCRQRRRRRWQRRADVDLRDDRLRGKATLVGATGDPEVALLAPAHTPRAAQQRTTTRCESGQHGHTGVEVAGADFLTVQYRWPSSDPRPTSRTPWSSLGFLPSVQLVRIPCWYLCHV